jgi:uncharacterized NAD(P)/FAD-binding protein YdhS
MEGVFDARTLEATPRTARVLVAGSGLTALDAITTLLRQGHRGPIVSVSRHGRRPRAHRRKAVDAPVTALLARIEGEIPGFLAHALAPPRALALSRAMRAHIRAATAAGAEWHAPFDDVRNVLWQVWPKLPPEEKRRALRHLRHWYDVHRFRAPPQNDHIVREAEAQGRVTFRRGDLKDVAAGDFDVVIRCTGLDPACGARDDPLLSGWCVTARSSSTPRGSGSPSPRNACRSAGTASRGRACASSVHPPQARSAIPWASSSSRRRSGGCCPGLLEEIGAAAPRRFTPS